MDRVDVLIIDDDSGVRWFLCELLRLNGFSNVSCSSGPEGLALAEKCHPDLAIIDYKLGCMNGVEVAQNLNQLLPETGIIFLTGCSPESIEEYPQELPVAAFIEKPFDVEALIGTIKGALTRANEGFVT